eukprot:14024713-Alexandrium_andersonii.AAC.1
MRLPQLHCSFRANSGSGKKPCHPNAQQPSLLPSKRSQPRAPRAPLPACCPGSKHSNHTRAPEESPA